MCQCTKYSTGRLMVNNDVGKMWKKVAEVYFMVLDHHLPGGTETIKNLSQHNMCLDQDLN